MAQPFALWCINDADRALESSLAEQIPNPAIVTRQEEPRNADLMKERFVALGKRRPNRLALYRSVPCAARRHCPAVGRKSDENRLGSMPFANHLADIHLAGITHLRRPGVPDVGIMFPQHNLRL